MFEPIPIAGCIFISMEDLWLLQPIYVCIRLFAGKQQTVFFRVFVCFIDPIVIKRKYFSNNCQSTHAIPAAKDPHIFAFDFVCSLSLCIFSTVRQIVLVPHDIAIYKMHEEWDIYLFLLRQAITRQFLAVSKAVILFRAKRECATNCHCYSSFILLHNGSLRKQTVGFCCCCCCCNWKKNASGIPSVFVLTKRNSNIDRTSEKQSCMYTGLDKIWEKPTRKQTQMKRKERTKLKQWSLLNGITKPVAPETLLQK